MSTGSPDTDDKPLWIEVVTDTYVPDVNGVALSLGRLCSGLRARGHHVEVIRSGLAEDEGGEWVPWWPLPGYWEIRVGAPWPGQFRRRWRKQRPDVVYVAIESPLGYSAVAAARGLGIPVVGGFHTNFREYLHRYGMPRFAEKVWIYQKWFHSRLARTLVPSPDARDKLVQAGFSSVGVLGRGVDTVLFDPAKRSETIRAEWGAGPETPVVAVVGRVSPEKNIELAIRAFDHMRPLHPGLVCVVIGDGPARAALEAANAGVRFTGYRRGEDLAACYASADILLFPSETETFGNVLLEGMASGLAAVAYDDAAAAWHGVHGGNLLKVPKGDVDSFLAASCSMLDRPLRRTISIGARKTAEALSWAGVVVEMENILWEVSKKP